MTNDDMDRIEAALDIHLPLKYRTVMHTYPFDADGNAANALLVNDPVRIINLNSHLHLYSRGKSIATQYLWIGSSGAEDFYVNMQQDDLPVYCRTHSSDQMVQNTDTFEEWVAYCRREIDELRTIEHNARRVRWWQFGSQQKRRA